MTSRHHPLSALVLLCLAAAPARAQAPRLANGSFEADGATISGVGYVGMGNRLSGWTASGPIGAARNTAGMAFFDNGVVPDGRCVAVLQNLNSIRQMVQGFRAGATYRLSVRANGRALDAPDFGGLRVEVNGTPVIDVPHVAPVGGTNPYRSYSALFRSGTGSCDLVLRQTNPRPGVSVLLDDVRIVPETARRGQSVIAANPAAPLETPLVGDAEDLTDRRWVWTNESREPAISAPAGTRWFRREFSLPSAPHSAVVVMTADNGCRLRVNGHDAGWGDSFARLFRADVTHLLRPGANVLSVEATNAGTAPNPAGLVAMLTASFSGRRAPLVVATDASWRWSPTRPRGWDAPGYSGPSRQVAQLVEFGSAPWGWVGPPSRRIPRAFPEFRVPGQERALAPVRKLLQLHLPGARPMATLWDGWLGMAGLWASNGDGKEAVERARQWREVLLTRTISPEGYVSTHQHRGYGHSEGWPIPLYSQTGGVGFHFSLADDVLASWVARLTRPDEWTAEGLAPVRVDPQRGWLLNASSPSCAVTTPRFDIPMAAAPFVRVEWQATGPSAARAYVQWATQDKPQFTEDRRVDFAPPSGKMAYANVPICDSPAWRPEDRMVALRIGLEGAQGGQVALKSVITPADTRHNVNNANYLQGCTDYVAWTGDVDFLRRNMARMRLAMRYAIGEYRLRESRCVDMPWYGHDGRGGFVRMPDGTRVSRWAVGVANNYWDLLPFGGKDALCTVYCYDALGRMAALEREVQAHPEWRVPTAGRLDAADLDALAESMRAYAGRLFWNVGKGRFVACIDRDGVAHDYGYTFVNLEAIHYGFATPEQANAILDWLDGRRILAGETSSGPDIYHWRFAPRASTIRNTEWYSGMWEPKNVAWGDQVQDGGAVLGFAYHDLMARLRARGPDDAWNRLRAIGRWFDDVQAEGGYRRYYAKPGRGNLQGGGPPGGLGMDEEFFESVLVPQVMLYGFMGARPTLSGLAVDPHLPTSWPSLAITRVRYHGLVVDLAADRRTVRATVRGGAPVGPVRILPPPGRWRAATVDARGRSSAAAPQDGGYALPPAPGHALLLTRVERPSTAPERRPKAPEVWMNHVQLEGLVRDGARWDFVQRHLDALEFPINVIAFLMPAEDMRRLVAVLKQHHIAIAVECGYFDWLSRSADFSAPSPKGITDTLRDPVVRGVGAETARVEIGKLRNLVAAGASPDYLNLDGPIRRMLWPGSDVGRGDVKGLASIDECVDELIAYMRTMRREFPRVQFFALTNFPNWGWKGEPSYWGGMFYGDYFEAVQRVIDGTRKAGIPILGVTADNPYEYAMGTQPHKAWMPLPREAQPTKPRELASVDWMARVLDLERYVKSRGLQFNLIVNSQGGGEASNEAFCRTTLQYLDAYRKAGGTPDRYIVQTWYKFPERVAPEDEPYTLTNLVKEAIQRVKPAAR